MAKMNNEINAPDINIQKNNIIMQMYFFMNKIKHNFKLHCYITILPIATRYISWASYNLMQIKNKTISNNYEVLVIYLLLFSLWKGDNKNNSQRKLSWI